MPTITYSEEERKEFEESVQRANGGFPWVFQWSDVHKDGVISIFRLPVTDTAFVKAQCSTGSGLDGTQLYGFELHSNDWGKGGELDAIQMLVDTFYIRACRYPWEESQPAQDDNI